MTILSRGFFYRLSVFTMAAILAAAAHALEMKPERELPAGVIKIPMMVRADSPKIAISKEGKLIVAAAFAGRQSRVALFRFLANGQVDRSFGNNGESLTGADGEENRGRTPIES